MTDQGQAPVAALWTADPREAASWEGLRDLAAVMHSGWSLAGGSLVRLHVAERGGGGSRSTRDIDVRADPGSISRVVRSLRAIGFAPDGLNPAGQDHRWVRGAAQIDILAPEFLGSRLLDRSHPGLGKLLATRGAQFGLARTEAVLVSVDDTVMQVRRPSLVGALYEKASALLVPLDVDKQRHLEDISLLVAIMRRRDRLELLELRRREQRRLRAAIQRAAALTTVSAGEQSALRDLDDLLGDHLSHR